MINNSSQRLIQKTIDTKSIVKTGCSFGIYFQAVIMWELTLQYYCHWKGFWNR